MKMLSLSKRCGVVGLCLLQVAGAIEVDWNSTTSIKKAAGTMAYDMMAYYQGNLTGFVPGVLPSPYYWWEAGAMFGALINYWHFTGDSTYNDVTMAAMQRQVGEFKDYMPQEHRSSLGNDDQGFWAIAALMAAELNFPNPLPTQPSWLGLVQAVFNEQIGRWDTSNCGGGLRWQIYVKNGYDLKNTISNGLLFNIAARLARYTGDDMYLKWADKAWNWLWDIQLINHDTWDVYDNAEADVLNCTEWDRYQWTYNAAVVLSGAATMFNITDGSEVWRNRTQNLLDRVDSYFFHDGVMEEICEFNALCNLDQRSFKAYLARWMTHTSQMAQFTHTQVHRLLGSSARAAAAQCIGGAKGTKCGIKWWLNGTWDGVEGVGEQMSALEVTLSVLVGLDVPGKLGGGGGEGVAPPVTNTTGGTSLGDPGAGYNYTAPPPDGSYVYPPANKDKIGAWALTAVLVVSVLAGTYFMWSDLWETETVSEIEKTAPPGEGSRAKSPSGRGGVLETIAEQIPMPRYRGGNIVT